MVIFVLNFVNIMQVFGDENTAGLITETFSLAQAEVIPDWIHQNFSALLISTSRRARRAAVSTSSYFVKMLLKGEPRSATSDIRVGLIKMKAFRKTSLTIRSRLFTDQKM